MSSGAQYQRLPTSDEPDKDDEVHGSESEPMTIAEDPRFNPPTPSPWKRAALLIFIAFMFWLAYQLRTGARRQPKVVHAHRYSNKHKFRPAASPIITERLKDGRLRVRGGHPAV